MKRTFSAVLFLVLSTVNLIAQAPHKPTSGEIYESIQKLNFLGTVLYLAAHPDDENTRMISYFANDVKARTAYLSITRGDGGQNLIGPELRELLGVIRTQELLAARRTDGGQQFFTRANDFGYSKHPDETLEIWNREEVMKDVVTVIRNFKPDVIINRFNHRTPGSTHGHHTSSAMLSNEAFDLVSDRNYKSHLKNDEPWKVSRLFFNTSWWFYGSRENFLKADKTNLISIDIGTYYKHKGLSNSEIASLSRSKHRSQGFGSTGSRGSETEYLEFLKGEFPNDNDVFYGIDTSWGRVKGGAPIGEMLDEIEKEFDFNNPAASIPGLLKVYKRIEALDEDHWKPIKLEDLKQCIAACAGIYLEVVANRAATTLNNKNEYRVEAINRSRYPVVLESVQLDALNKLEELDTILSFNQRFNITTEGIIALNTPPTYPYWLHKKGSLGMYSVADSDLIGSPETPRSVSATFSLRFDDQVIPFKKDVVYKYNDPVKGEVYKPFEVLPAVTASFTEKVYLFATGDSQEIVLKVTSESGNIAGSVSLKAPESWSVSPSSFDISFSEEREEILYTFKVQPPQGQSEGIISPVVKIGDKKYNKELIEIDYDHIPLQSVVLPSQAKVVRLDMDRKGQLIGYIHGAGDAVPTSLRQIGYTVVELTNGDITAEKMANFDAVILGIRAYNTNDRAKYFQEELHTYAENGGTLIVQYNTSRGVKVPEVGPFPLKLSRDRVTDENSNVSIINPSHPVLNFPNTITPDDFNGWVQERGLYFPGEWDPRYEAVLSMNDKNETAKTGSLLVAEIGKGHFIYTGLSFFRELPAGVPGAYKLFTNMLSIGKNKSTSTLKN